MGMVLAALAVMAVPQSVPAQEIRVPSIRGDVRLIEGFESKVLGNRRTIRVYLPPGYDRSRNRYPVLYMGDGQNLFDGMTSFLPNKEWRIDETCEDLIKAGTIEPIIVVGVDNAGAERANEYLPTRMRRGSDEMGGRAGQYGRFLAEELKPMIDRRFRTKKDSANTGIGGSSFGGIVSLYVGLTQPQVFSKLAVVSPSVWWDNQVMLKFVELLPQKPKSRVWLDMGTAEGPGAEASAVALKNALVAKGWKEGEDLKFVIEPGAIHQEGAWAGRMPQILQFLFPAKG